MIEYEIMPGLKIVVDESLFRVKNALTISPQGNLIGVQLDLKISAAGGQESKVENVFSAEKER
jgi:hypothetical protein